jgi:hypothetical protein
MLLQIVEITAPVFLLASIGYIWARSGVAYDMAFGGIATAEEEGERIAASVGNHLSVMMANHGLTPPEKSMVLIGIKAWSWYMQIAAS